MERCGVGAAVTDGPENVIAVVIVALHSLEIFVFQKGTRLKLFFFNSACR